MRLMKFFENVVSLPSILKEGPIPLFFYIMDLADKIRQFPKHIGRKLQVRTNDDQVIRGKFAALNGNELVLEEQVKKKAPVEHKIEWDKIREARVVLEF